MSRIDDTNHPSRVPTPESATIEPPLANLIDDDPVRLEREGLGIAVVETGVAGAVVAAVRPSDVSPASAGSML